MAKAKKRGRPAGQKKKTSKRKRQRDIGSQTEQPFEQDSSVVSDNMAEQASHRS